MTGAILLVTVPATINRSALTRRKGVFSRASLIAPPTLQGAGPPGIDVAEEEDNQKNDDLDKAEDAELVVNHGPGEEEERLDLEDDEDEGQEVETDRGGLAGRGGGRLDAAFVRLALAADGAAAVGEEGEE